MKTFLFASLLLLTLPAAFGQDAPPPSERISLRANHTPVGGGEFQEADAFITVHQTAKPNGAAFVICPGDGYGGLVTGPEGHGMAKWLNGHAMTGIVLECQLPKGNALVPLLDAQRAIHTVRSRHSARIFRACRGRQAVVPPENSQFHQLLKSNGVETKYLELPSGGHGFNRHKGPMWDVWRAQSLEWLAARKFIPAADVAAPKQLAASPSTDASRRFTGARFQRKIPFIQSPACQSRPST